MKVIHLFGEHLPQRKENQVHQGPIHFTCPHCNTSAEMKLQKMIFKVIEFQCQTCRAPFRLTNPNFVPSPKNK